MELIIPYDKIGKDVWVADPNKAKEGGYMRKEGGKFHMDEELTQKDREWLLKCGIPMVERATKIEPKKKTKKAEEADDK